MRIAIDIRHLCAPNPTGIGYYSREIISRLIQYTDTEWTLFASGSPHALRHIPESFLQEAPHITIQRHREPNRLLNTKLCVNRISLDDLVASPVHSWFFPNLDFIRTKKPYVMTVHDLSFTFLPECFSQRARLWHSAVNPERLYKQSRHLISVSKSTTTDLHSIYGVREQKVSTIPLAASDMFHPGILPGDHHALLRYGIKGKFLLSLCTIEPRKNHIGLILAYSAWRAASTQTLPLIIAGGRGYKAHKVLRAARRSPFTKDIHFVGYVKNEDRPVLMRHAAALLFPSFYEGFGLPIREALQSGTPVLTGNTSGMIEHVGAIMHVSPWHIHEIAAGINAVLTMSHAKKMKESHQNWDEVARRTHEVLTRELYT